MKKSIPTAEGRATVPVEEAVTVDDLKLELDRLRDELATLPARKRSALEADDSDAFAEASLRELQLPGLIKFAEARLLRAQHTEVSLLLASTEAALIEAKSAMDPLVQNRDQVLRQTEQERRDAQAAVDAGSLRLRQCNDEIFMLRTQLNNFERQIEALLSSE